MELVGKLANETTYAYWTFNGKVPGPFLRVRVGDTVELTFKNREGSRMIHSVDLHAVTGPGGGAVLTQTPPGETQVVPVQGAEPGALRLSLRHADGGQPHLQRNVRADPRGAGRRSAEGDRIYTWYSRLPDSGWSAAPGLPAALVEGAAYRSVVVYGGGVVLSLALAALAAIWVARSINQPMHELPHRRPGARPRRPLEGADHVDPGNPADVTARWRTR